MPRRRRHRPRPGRGASRSQVVPGVPRGRTGGCGHAPPTELPAAGQPLITRGPASPLAEASHTFATDWPRPGPAPSPARGAGQAERLPEWGGGQTARSAAASTSECLCAPVCGRLGGQPNRTWRFSPAGFGKSPADAVSSRRPVPGSHRGREPLTPTSATPGNPGCSWVVQGFPARRLSIYHRGVRWGACAEEGRKGTLETRTRGERPCSWVST